MVLSLLRIGKLPLFSRVKSQAVAAQEYSIHKGEVLAGLGWARPEDRKKRLTSFTHDLSRCMFCGLCQDACPVDAPGLTLDFEDCPLLA
jgi:ferredoxin